MRRSPRETMAPAAPAAKAWSRKRWPSVASPFSAMKRSPRLDLARIERDAARLEAPPTAPCRGVRGPSAHRRDRRFPAERVHERRSIARPHAAHSRATATSSKGSTRSPTIWPCSWPLPARRMMSSGPGLGDRRGDRLAPARHLARVRSAGEDVAPDRGRILAPRIVVGDDDAVGEPRRRPRPFPAACRRRGRRRRRRR